MGKVKKMKQYFKYYSHNYPKTKLGIFEIIETDLLWSGHFLESESKSLEFCFLKPNASKVRKHENLYDCIGPIT